MKDLVEINPGDAVVIISDERLDAVVAPTYCYCGGKDMLPEPRNLKR